MREPERLRTSSTRLAPSCCSNLHFLNQKISGKNFLDYNLELHLELNKSVVSGILFIGHFDFDSGGVTAGKLPAGGVTAIH